MGLLHRKNTQTDVRAPEPHTNTNAQGEHISLRKRFSMRIHHHHNEEPNSPDIVRQADNMKLQSPLQPQVMYDTTQYETPSVEQHTYQMPNRPPPPPPSDSQGNFYSAPTSTITKPNYPPPPPPSTRGRSATVPSSSSPQIYDASYSYSDDTSSSTAYPSSSSTLRVPPPRPQRNMSSTNLKYAASSSASNASRPLPAPRRKANEEEEYRSMCNCIVIPYRYPYGEFPKDDADTDAHVQKVVSGFSKARR